MVDSFLLRCRRAITRGYMEQSRPPLRTEILTVRYPLAGGQGRELLPPLSASRSTSEGGGSPTRVGGRWICPLTGSPARSCTSSLEYLPLTRVGEQSSPI